MYFRQLFNITRQKILLNMNIFVCFNCIAIGVKRGDRKKEVHIKIQKKLN